MKDQRFKGKGFVALAAALVLAGCASKAPTPGGDGAPPVLASPAIKDGYIVKKGDTLYSIALDHGLDYRDLVAWNTIENPNRILVGQALRVRPPGAVSSPDAVVVRPITTGSAVEQRALSSGGSTSNGGSSSGSSGGVGDALKREPKAGKEPYSDQALARAQAQAKVVEPVAAAAATAAAPVVVATKPEIRPEARPATRAEARPEYQAEARPDETTAGSEEVIWIWPANGKLIGTFTEGGNKGVDIAGKAGDAVLAASGGKVVYSGTGLRGYGKLVIIKHNNTFLTAYAHNQNVLVKEGQAVSKGQKIAEMGSTDADQVKLHFEVRRQGKPVDPLKHLPQR
ncbi:Peptidase M23 [Candidatus Accumulibacter aalborgensis]|uniref:Peptidase M23 n=1 Tax=Candidatus Accumulibacter aalborgensis TaxID=1860102 RepID=A0A1A8XJS6_9PROT|nr:peptidoglycan DD-metalloendopeptidase family protein [Candidatus Accumulibacter aalborgensis]SBT04198.1 Peptidase M23 [Candidatus Accumulibacter aalborgensis]